MKKNILLTVIFSVFVAACSQKEHYARFDIEQDGAIRFLMLEEIVELELGTPITAESIAETREYKRIKENALVDGLTEYPEIFQHHLQVYKENNGFVDAERYAYVIEIPVKTEQLIQDLPTSLGSKYYRPFGVNRCINLNYLSGGDVLSLNVNPEFDGQYYHYKLVVEASRLAALYLFDSVTDLCLDYHDHKSDFGEDYDIESNILKIDAEEIKNALNAVGILHE